MLAVILTLVALAVVFAFAGSLVSLGRLIWALAALVVSIIHLGLVWLTSRKEQP